eukprot:CAMPEP_0115605954 /NCGR_PEP_ID=MMETSP0272-20121206/17726_1 /TAXON_ID=71861 /ORGANISM="Scrippsiella trochoidea, Strain CCMP3099" /LENGTH=237 /DNA_ID=CAMNT_0003041557 /DNA_START=401 /DNA_END=1111 /DNA_ORIENTATION=-
MTFRISARTGAKSTELAPFSTDKTSTSLTFWISARIGATSMGCTSRMADKTGAKSTPDLTLCISATIRAKSDESASRRVDNIPVQATSGLILLTSAVNLERVRSGFLDCFASARKGRFDTILAVKLTFLYQAERFDNIADLSGHLTDCSQEVGTPHAACNAIHLRNDTSKIQFCHTLPDRRDDRREIHELPQLVDLVQQLGGRMGMAAFLDAPVLTVHALTLPPQDLGEINFNVDFP